MSFDRVLPRPPVLYDEVGSRLHRSTSSLLEHKIMTDRNKAMQIKEISWASTEKRQRINESENCSTAVSQMQLSAKSNAQLATSYTVSSRQGTPTLKTVESTVRDRSDSSSPTRLAAAKEAASQFCLCQPDPKIPRPRNGK